MPLTHKHDTTLPPQKVTVLELIMLSQAEELRREKLDTLFTWT